MSADGLQAAVTKMRAGGVEETAIRVFQHYYEQLESGVTGLIREGDIRPLESPPRLGDMAVDEDEAHDALDTTVVLKLNGGLGTGMGMDRAKTLLPVRDDTTFLDVIARQVLSTRERWGARLPLMFLNSFRTHEDTLDALRPYDGLAVAGLPLDLLQNREPKLGADDLAPIEWPEDPELEWCPPGHGDLYTVLYASGILDRLLEAGMRRAFISNADNLGATADPRVAAWFAGSGAPYACEVCRRTAADRKGGHLAVRVKDDRLVLRDSAQTAPEDQEAFADDTVHRYFHTNNLWIDLGALHDVLREHEGVFGLPMIRNVKTVDPADGSTPKVIQVETAMGAAVEVFEGAQAIEVERSRFLPVKSTNDLLALRSDAYDLSDEGEVRLAAGRDEAPYVDLDPEFYKVVAEFDTRFPHGAPSLREAGSLRVAGDWTFGANVVVKGDVALAADDAPGEVPDGAVLSEPLD